MAKIGPSCVCGFDAADQQDLTDHIIEMARGNDPYDHAEAH